MLRAGDRILVHCGAGIGRTGMFATCCLIGLGLLRTEAEKQIQIGGSRAERPAQEALISRYAQSITGV